MRMFRPLLRSLRRHDRPVTVDLSNDSPPTQSVCRDQETAYALADAIDEALDRGQLAHAERIARTAVRLVSRAPRLLEPIARLRLAQGEPQIALDLLDQFGAMRESRRLLRALCLLQLGRRDEAHADLLQWSQRATAPMPARRLLALLDWCVDDHDTAMQQLLRNLHHLEDPSSLAQLVALSAASGRSELAARGADRLRQAAITRDDGASLRLLLDSLGMNKAENIWPTASDDQVESLSRELLAQPAVIPALVSSCQLHRTSAQKMDLLLRAFNVAQAERPDDLTITNAIQSLEELADTMRSTDAWARHGSDTDAGMDAADDQPSVIGSIHLDDTSEPPQERAA
ncbi:MAG: hypothetical protein AAF432_03635 [Planctomycetota bacterium]